MFEERSPSQGNEPIKRRFITAADYILTKCFGPFPDGASVADDGITPAYTGPPTWYAENLDGPEFPGGEWRDESTSQSGLTFDEFSARLDEFVASKSEVRAALERSGMLNEATKALLESTYDFREDPSYRRRR